MIYLYELNKLHKQTKHKPNINYINAAYIQIVPQIVPDDKYKMRSFLNYLILRTWMPADISEICRRLCH